MSSGVDPTAARDELIRIIRQVRRRWRLKNALRGAAIVLAAGAAVLEKARAMQIGKELPDDWFSEDVHP